MFLKHGMVPVSDVKSAGFTYIQRNWDSDCLESFSLHDVRFTYLVCVLYSQTGRHLSSSM
jgi:hypothetical protein